MAHQDEYYPMGKLRDGEVMQEVFSVLNGGMDSGGNPLAGALRILLNEAMKAERTQYMGAEPYERSEESRGYANGFKPKTLNTRVGRKGREPRAAPP